MSLEFGFRGGGTRFQKIIYTLQREIQAAFPPFFRLFICYEMRKIICPARRGQQGSSHVLREKSNGFAGGCTFVRLGKLAALDFYLTARREMEKGGIPVRRITSGRARRGSRGEIVGCRHGSASRAQTGSPWSR